jgi:heme-degrading monooxygenase HmoA
MTIAREWSGTVPTERAAGFHEHLLATGIAEAETIDGFLGATVLRRDEGGRARFTLVTCWVDESAVRHFAGTDDDTARLYPGDEQFGLLPDRTATHHKVMRSQSLTATRQAYLMAARAAATLLEEPAVAASWDQSSALEHYAVSGLAGHLAGQIFFAEDALGRPEPDIEPIPILDYYDRVAWIRSGHDSETHLRIRHGSTLAATDGAAALATRAEAAITRLPEILTATPVLRRVRLPSWQWSLTLDDFLLSRAMELAVHIDDLAVSLGLPTPPLAQQVTGPVLDLLVRLAIRRHGEIPVLRALSRAERAPATIAAF